MHSLFSISFLLFVVSACTSGNKDTTDRRQRDYTGWRDTHDNKRPPITVPIETENEQVNLVFELNKNRTILSITSEAPYEKMFILSSFSGTAFQKYEDHIGIYSADLGDGLSVNFNIGQNSSVYQSDGQSIEVGEHIAETTGTVQFYLEDGGEKIPFCIDVDNKAPKYVNLSVRGAEEPCHY